MSSPISQPSADSVVAIFKKRIRNLTLLLVITSILSLALIAASGVVGWRKLNAIQKAADDTQFSQFVSDFNAVTDYVEPTVNTIQFLRHGYSIDFNSVDYTQNGLELSGTVGNPTNLWISSLALDMTARPYPYQIKDKWLKDVRNNGFPWWSSDWDFGHAQTTVGGLNPGSTAFFHIAIPNVKQTSNGLQIAVSFSGERYQYLGK